MAYTKPGVLITQVQETVSPALVEPDLYAGIIARPYYVFKPSDVTISGYWNPANGVMEVGLNALRLAQYPNVSGVIQANSIYVDLVGVSGVMAGQRVHATYNNNGGGESASYDCFYTAGTGTVTVSGTTANYASTYSGSAFRVEIGFSVLRYDLQKAVVFEGGSDIQEAIGPTTVFNELGTALTIATSNSNRKTFAYGVVENMSNSDTPRNAAQEALSTKNVYVYAPMCSNFQSAITDWKVFVESQSSVENKKESILVAAPKIPWRDNEYGATGTTALSNTAADIASRAAITQARRFAMVHPDVAYVREKLHISKIKQSYLANNLGDDSFYTNYNLFALLTGSLTLSDGTKYFADDEITDAVWTAIEADGINELTVLVPVPGYFVAAAVAGQISGSEPEAPLTNVPITGIERIKYSSEWFSDTNLNTMATGGTYIMVQDQPTLPIACRHQLTTDTTSVEARELSIQKALDFTAKYLRRNMKSLIGRNNITDQFIKTLKTIVRGIGIQLVRKGVVADFKLLEIKQDETERDRVKIKISVLAQYPSNYIEIDLIY